MNYRQLFEPMKVYRFRTAMKCSCLGTVIEVLNDFWDHSKIKFVGRLGEEEAGNLPQLSNP